MAKEVFEQELGDMLEFDKSLDINAILDSTPALETTVVEDDKSKTNDKKKDEGPTLKNINKVLEDQGKTAKKDEKAVEDVVEDIQKTDDKASASLNKTTDKPSSDTPFTVIFARDLVAQGLLSSFDEDKFNEDVKAGGDAEALRNLIKGEIETNINAAKQDLDAGYQEYLGLVGRGVQPETAGDLLSLKERFSSIKADDLVKDENVELRKQVISDYLKLTSSMSDTKITKLVQNSVDMGDDVEESKEYLATLNKLVGEQLQAEEQNAQARMAAQRDEIKRTTDALRDDINALDEIIPGVGINKQTKVKMFDAITKPVQDKQGRTTNSIWAKRADDAAFFDTRLAYLLETGFFEKGKAWNKATQAKVTKTATDLETALKNKNNTGSSVGSPIMRSPELDQTTKDNIDSMRGIFG